MRAQPPAPAPGEPHGGWGHRRDGAPGAGWEGGSVCSRCGPPGAGETGAHTPAKTLQGWDSLFQSLPQRPETSKVSVQAPSQVAGTDLWVSSDPGHSAPDVASVSTAWALNLRGRTEASG